VIQRTPDRWIPTFWRKFIFREDLCGEDGDSMYLQNIDTYLPDKTHKANIRIFTGVKTFSHIGKMEIIYHVPKRYVKSIWTRSCRYRSWMEESGK
jgi:hypothetical protein